jgi:hypothetical protein
MHQTSPEPQGRFVHNSPRLELRLVDLAIAGETLQ